MLILTIPTLVFITFEAISTSMPTHTATPASMATPSPTPTPTTTGITYYIAKTGNNNNLGTEAQPWLTISKAASAMTAGDTVYVKQGTYNEQVWVSKSGVAGNYITYSAYPGDENKAIIDGTRFNYNWNPGEEAPVMLEASYINFTGFRVINSNMVGIRASGTINNVNLYKNWIYNTAGSCIAFRGNKYGSYDIKNIIIEGNDAGLCLNGEYGEAISIRGVDGFEIKNNIVHDGGDGRPSDGAGGEGIDAIHAANGKIHHNIVYNMKTTGIYLDGGSGVNKNIDVYNNIVHDIRLYSSVQIAAENPGGSVQNINFYNNIVYNAASNAFAISDYHGNIIKNININGNTFRNPIWIENGAKFTNITIRNNIAKVIHDDKGVTKDHNWVDSQGAPGFVNEAGHDYNLLNNAAVKDIGTSNGAPAFDYDGNARPKGAGYDIGAFEY